MAKEKSICNCTELELLSVYLDAGVVPFSKRTEKRTNATSKDLSKYQRVDPGDFVLNNQQASEISWRAWQRLHYSERRQAIFWFQRTQEATELQGIADGSGTAYQREKRALQPVSDRQRRSKATWYHSPQYRADPWQKNWTQTGTGALIIPFDSFPFLSIPKPRKDNYMNEQKNKNYTVNEKGCIVVHNYCAAELPKITVTIRSGQTTYRFNGSYDGTRSLSGKLLDHMAKEN